MAYQAITFSNNEIPGAAKFNQLAENDEYLKEHLPLFTIEGTDGPQTGQLCIEAGIHDMMAGQYDVQHGGLTIVSRVQFQNTFIKRPILTVQYVSNDINFREVATMVHGLDGGVQPSQNGFTVHMAHNKGSAAFPLQAGKYFIHYQAIGVKA